MFQNFSRFLRPRIYIDLGTANTLVMEENFGLVANEPSVVAYEQQGVYKKRIVAIGDDAKKKLGRTPGQLLATHPLREGVVAELDTTQAMLGYFMKQASKKRWLPLRPELVISLPYGVSDVERRAVRDCAFAAGAADVTLIEEPMAAALGTGLPVHAPQGSMVIDIGGGTTEIAVISLYGVVVCEAVRVGGHAFDEAIVDHFRKKQNLIIGPASAERIKIEVASVLAGEHESEGSVRGVDFTTGLPREVRTTSSEIYQSLEPLVLDIVSTAKKALQSTPPDLLTDILRNGATLAGGGALLSGMRRRLELELKIPVKVADDPLLAIANGGLKVLKDQTLLSRIALQSPIRNAITQQESHLSL